MKQFCWWCGSEGCNLEHGISDEEKRMGEALFHAEFCDHYCCGLPKNLCVVRTMIAYLKEQYGNAL